MPCPEEGRSRSAPKTDRRIRLSSACTPRRDPGLTSSSRSGTPGRGSLPRLLEKIFDPFFTTKEVGSGTGLGLSTVASIVKSHGGFVKVYSVVGEGTSFSVFLPATGDVANPRTGEPQPRHRPGHGELILVVDDEPTILQLARGILEAHGYRTILARNGSEALAQFAEKRGPIQVVLTDLMMPELDGPSTIRAIQQLHPQVPIIASSGLPPSGEGGRGRRERVRLPVKTVPGTHTPAGRCGGLGLEL